MNLILTCLQHKFDLHMDHNSDMGTYIIGSIVNSDMVVYRWQRIEMHWIMNGHELWIPRTCKADTPNVNLPSNIQRTEWQREPDLATASATVLKNPAAAVAALIKITVGVPRAAAGTMIIKTPGPVALGHTPVKMAGSGTNPGAMMVATRARKSTRWVIAMAITMNPDPPVEEHQY